MRASNPPVPLNLTSLLLGSPSPAGDVLGQLHEESEVTAGARRVSVGLCPEGAGSRRGAALSWRTPP